MLLSDRIKALAPANAAYFRLRLKLPDGTVRTFPPGQGAYFGIGESPYGMANGNYFLYFYDEEERPISHPERRILIDLQEENQRPDQTQLSMSFMNARREPPPLRALHSASPKHQTPLESPGHSAAPQEACEGAPAKAASAEEADLEFRRCLQAIDLEERQQEFIKNSTYITEIGELFALARMSRREILELQRTLVAQAQQAYRDAEQMKRGVRDLFQLQQEVLAAAAAQIGRPPPPPPDYVGLGHSALSLLKEIGVALIQRSSGRDTSNPLPAATGGNSPAQLQAPPAERVPAEDAPPAERLEQMMQKLKSLSELEMATAMSSPAGWKRLLDTLQAKPTESSPGENTDTTQGAPSLPFLQE